MVLSVWARGAGYRSQVQVVSGDHHTGNIIITIAIFVTQNLMQIQLVVICLSKATDDVNRSIIMSVDFPKDELWG